MSVAPARAEEARAAMVELFPEGFEEVERPDGLELAAYTDAQGEQRLRAAFGAVDATEAPENWAERWRGFHRGARVGSLWVGPPWELPPADATPVVVDPGRAFGTGGHPTTRLCLELLQLAPRGSLVDVGCGSGVLAVAGALVGFEPVTALDSDPAAVEATGENARRNRVRIEARLADALEGPLPETDVAVANITGEALPLIPFRSALVIASGYLTAAEIALHGYVRGERRTLEAWAADLFRRH
ncbi:MAG: 50S ribosomal protein L11 methyltransferase [Thermoleophilia bacterium]|nr:50S ribosomal protein L11 methyltransferase [Thermoleophilia bacterium]